MRETWLRARLAEAGAVAGSVHRRRGALLHLEAAVHLPPPVVAAIQRIPKGKGMAGLAWARRAPVSTCNLAADPSGDVRPGAKTVAAGAAVAVPVFDGAGRLRGVVGFAFAEEMPLGPDALSSLGALAATLPEGPPQAGDDRRPPT